MQKNRFNPAQTIKMIFRCFVVFAVTFSTGQHGAESRIPDTILYNTIDDRHLQSKVYRNIDALNTKLTDEEGRILSMDVDYQRGLLYWYNAERGQIKRAFISTSGAISNAIIIQSGLRALSPSLSVDWIRGDVYFLNNNVIEKYTYDGYLKTIILRIGTRTNSIVADPVDEDVYYLYQNYDDKYYIGRIKMNGDLTTQTNIVTIGNRFWVHDLRADAVERRLYWIEHNADTIASVEFSGANHRNMTLHLPSSISILSLAVSRNMLYWTTYHEWRTSNHVDLQYQDLSSEWRRPTTILRQSYVWRLLVYDNETQPMGH